MSAPSKKLITKLPRGPRYEVHARRGLLSDDYDPRVWYWRLRAANGEIVATGGGEQFKKPSNAARACRTVARINRPAQTARQREAARVYAGCGVRIFVEIASDTWREVAPA